MKRRCNGREKLPFVGQQVRRESKHVTSGLRSTASFPIYLLTSAHVCYSLLRCVVLCCVVSVTLSLLVLSYEPIFSLPTQSQTQTQAQTPHVVAEGLRLLSALCFFLCEQGGGGGECGQMDSLGKDLIGKRRGEESASRSLHLSDTLFCVLHN